MNYLISNKDLTCVIHKMSSKQAAEVRLLALEHKAFLTWLKGGVDVLLSFKKARDLEKFVMGLEKIIDHYESLDSLSLFLGNDESDSLFGIE